MRSPRLKPISRVVIAALVVFVAFLAKSLTVVFSGSQLVVPAQKLSIAPPAAKTELLPQAVDPSLFDKLKARNIFMTALILAKKGPMAGGETGPPPLGPNEIRDPESGRTFKYLGSVNVGESRLALFARVGPVAKGEPRFFLHAKGATLAPNIRIVDVGEKWVKIAQAGEQTDLNVFNVQIKRLGNEPPSKK